PCFSLSGSESAVVSICQAVEGMPLGIELAASWLRVLPCDQIAQQIRRSLDFLATPLRNVAERHRSMRMMLDHSWRLLSESEQRVLSQLSVFRGGFDLQAAEHVTSATLSVLASLTDKSMIRINHAGRYNLHELLRQYGADRLKQSGELLQAAHRHLEYF